MHIYIHVVKELTILSLKYLIKCLYVKQNIILKYYHKIDNTSQYTTLSIKKFQAHLFIYIYI